MVGVSHYGLSSRLRGHPGGWWSVSGGRKPRKEYSIFDLKNQQHQEEEGITILKVETPFVKVVRALPLLLVSVLAYQFWLKTGKVVFEGEGREDIAILKRFSGWAWLEESLALANISFLPAALYNLWPPAQGQLLSSLTESAVLFIMWYEAVKQ